MSNEPRLSRRESTSALRQPSSGRKRSGSIASTASRASLMFTSPAKGFGLTRKASTATLSLAPVSAVGSTLDHSLDPTSSEISIGGSTSRANGTDKPRAVRQATRAQDALRSVQARAPQGQTPILPPESDLTPLSESPSSAPVPLPSVPNDLPAAAPSTPPTSTSSSRNSPSRIPRPKSTLFTSSTGSRFSTAAPIAVPTAMNNETTATINETTTPAAPSSSPSASSKFRTPSMTPGFAPSRLGPRKASMNSVRSYDPTNNRRPIASSPLSTHTTTPSRTTTAVSPSPANLSIPDAGPTTSPSAVITATSASAVKPDIEQAAPSPAGSSWLSTLRGIARSPAPTPPTLPVSKGVEAPANTPASASSETSTATLTASPAEAAAGVVTEEPAQLNAPPRLVSRSSAGTLRPSQTPDEEGGVEAKEQSEAHQEAVSAPVTSQAVMVVGSSDSAVAGNSNGEDARDANTLRINTLAAQHSAGWTGHSPAGWLAWLTSNPASNAHLRSPVSVRQIGMGEEDLVMYIDSDSDGEGQTPVMPKRKLENDQGGNNEGEETDTDAMTEDVGPTPIMTPSSVGSTFEERRAGVAGWSWGKGQDAEAGPAGKGKGKGVGNGKTGDKRPGIGATAMSLDSVVSVLSEGEGEGERDTEGNVPAIPSINVKPAVQNTLGLNASALRYALQLPLLGRAKQQVPNVQDKIGERPGHVNEGESSGSQAAVRGTDVNSHERASASEAGLIIARYSDEHDFVIIEIEVDGWILINTEGGSPVSPLGHTPAAGRTTAGGNSWWDYYVGGANPSFAFTGREGSGPAAEMGGGLSSPAKRTEAARDSDSRSVSSSMLSTVLRPFGRSKDAKDPQESPVPAPTPLEDTRQATRPAKTQAELIKEEALARQSPSVVPALPGPVLNSATKSSWVSYFSSKPSRSTPTMSDGRAIKQRAENTTDMEVMDIDEEELSQPVEICVPSPATSSPSTKTGGASATGKPASPLTDSPSVKHKASIISQGKKSSASSSRSTKVSFPNLVLPTFGDTFYTVPRCIPPHIATAAPGASTAAPAPGPWKLKRTVKNLSTLLFNTNTADKSSGPHVPNAEMEEYQQQVRERRRLTNRANFAVVEPAVPRPPNTPRASAIRPGTVRSTSSFGSLAIDDFGNELPRVFSVLGDANAFGDIAGPMRAVVIGVHGWFPGAIVRSVFGEPTGTSIKFATMGVDAMRQFAEKHGLNLESVIPMPLEGEGTIERRVIKLYDDLLKHPQWLAELHRADVVLVATHSQGSIVSTHLIARLISDGHIRTKSNRDAVNRATENTGILPPIAPHRVCCLAMCGIHMGPLYSLNSSSLAQPYLQWFESQAARELFEFQDTDSEVSRNYVAALSTALDHGTKFVYVASLNDQVVPIYSGAFVAASHPLILRGLFLDGDAYSSSDFLSNLLVLLLRVKNAGLDEQGLVIHLSEATAGSLSGIGHSTAYEDLGPYSLAVRYLFETSDLAPDSDCKLKVDAFQARASRNDYEIPWLLHTLITDARIGRIFSPELSELRDSFADWKPATAILRDIQRKLAPIRMSPLRHSTTAEDTDSKVVNPRL